MIAIKSLIPSKVMRKNNDLHLLFEKEGISIYLHEEVYHYNTMIDYKGHIDTTNKIVIDITTQEIKNRYDTMVFNVGNRFVQFSLEVLEVCSNLTDVLNENYISKEVYTTTVEDTKVAVVCFDGLNGSTSVKNYHFKTNISDLKENEIVIVDSNGQNQQARFVKYYRGKKLPEKWVLRREDEGQLEFTEKVRDRIESPEGMHINHETVLLIQEMVQFNIDTLKDKYLEIEDFDNLEKLVGLER